MVGDVPWVTVLIVLVEGPIGTTNEPRYASSTEAFLPPADVPVVLGQGELARVGDAVGWHDVPGLFNDAQVHAWSNVTDAVHHAGGIIFTQLWHAGSSSHPEFFAGTVCENEVREALSASP